MTAIYIGALSLRFEGRVEEAEKCIESVMKSVTQVSQFVLICSYELGTTAIKYSNWSKAIQYLSHFHTSILHYYFGHWI
jgi:hypothetical protein